MTALTHLASWSRAHLGPAVRRPTDDAALGSAPVGTAPGGRHRETWMDVLRGLAIVLMVLYHSTEVLRHYATPAPEWVVQANEILAPVRMPTLVFLSGMLLHVSLAKGVGRYLDGKLRGIGYPFVVWTLIYLALTGAWTEATYIVVGGGSYLWYLFALLCYYVAALMLRRIPSLPLAVVSWVLSGLVPDGYFERMLFLFGFFLLGDVAARHRALLLRTVTSPWIIGLAAALTAWVAALSATGTTTRYELRFLWGAIAGVVLLAALARLLDRGRAAGALRSVGRNSLIFYVAHWPAMIVATVVLERLSGASPVLLLPVVALVGLGTGAVLIRAARHLPAVQYLFSVPRQRVRSVDR